MNLAVPSVLRLRFSLLSAPQLGAPRLASSPLTPREGQQRCRPSHGGHEDSEAVVV